MAQRALPAGAVRRRAMFGLMDADGWALAFLKGLFWFVLILLLLGYLPDRAYYFTVSPTISVGANIISPINLCPASNGSLPCPAPAGALVAWQVSPPQLALPKPVADAAAFQSGTNLYVVGGTSGGAAVADVYATSVSNTGNLSTWTPAAALPAPRARTNLLSVGGTPYAIGGVDAAGKPLDTVLEGVLKEGALASWKARDDLKLPQPLVGASVVSTAGGLWLIGGNTADGAPSRKVYRSLLSDAKPPVLGAWKEVGSHPLPEARTDAVALAAGGKFIYVIGGRGPNGPAATVFRLQLDTKGEIAKDLVAGGGALLGWGTATGSANLPEALSAPRGFAANQAMYVVAPAGQDGHAKVYWTVPNATTGDIGEWKNLSQSDVPEARTGATPAVVGSWAYLIGGTGGSGNGTGTLRANTAPMTPFFQLGLVGATIPGLAVKGDVGQNFGYLNAAGVGTVNFILLILIGLAFSHRQRTRQVLERISRGRYRAPREDEYFS